MKCSFQFLNDYLRIFNSCVPLQTVTVKKNSIKSKWITKGIKISRDNKRKLYLSYRQNPNEEANRHYWRYSKILTTVIKEANIYIQGVTGGKGQTLGGCSLR